MFKRDVEKKLAERLRQKNRFIQVLIGPRQVGKTTAIQQVLDELKMPNRYATADLPAPPDAGWIETQWNEARKQTAQKKPVILVLDEVQKINRWSEVVKREWDKDRRVGSDIRVVVLGSSSLLVQKGLTESLAGRFELLHAFHWSFSECAGCFGWDLDRYLYFGGYPGAAPLADEEDRWSAYVRDSLIESAISKDVLLLNLVEKPALMRNLFVLACEYGGQILSYQKMLGQLRDAGNTTTLAHYKRLLEAAYLVSGLEKFSGSRIRIRGSSPKWLPLNTALVTALGRRNFSETRKDTAHWGRLVEVAVGAHLYGEAFQHGLELFYWREGNAEVDYVLKKGRDLVAIEVKSGLRKPVQSGFEVFKKKYKSAQFVTVGSGGIPLEKFLASNTLNLF